MRGRSSTRPRSSPNTVRIKGVSGWFAISTDKPTQHKFAGGDDAVGLGGRDAAGHAERPDRGGQHALRPRPGERHHVLGGADDGPPRLAAGDPGLHRVAALAGRGSAHPGQSRPSRCPPARRSAPAPGAPAAAAAPLAPGAPDAGAPLRLSRRAGAARARVRARPLGRGVEGRGDVLVDARRAQLGEARP